MALLDERLTSGSHTRLHELSSNVSNRCVSCSVEHIAIKVTPPRLDAAMLR